MNIAILNLCAPYPILDQHGTAAELIEHWISEAFNEAIFTELTIAMGEALPEPQSFDGYIVSGSEKGVYDEAAWIEPLKVFLRQLRNAKIPVFGICFGHQIMAEAYGGTAVKADKGFVVGVQQYTEYDQHYNAQAMHRDQVVVVPDSATVTASASYCPVAALSYDFPARSVQFHPEFQQPFVNAAIDDFEGSELDSNEASVARTSLRNNSVETSLYAEEIATFFRQTIRTT
jgi:GMP synthase-like glutamine amidotransferase